MNPAAALAAFALTVPTNSIRPDRPPILQGVRRIVCLGDSITEAGGAPGGYVTLLQEYLDRLYGGQAASNAGAGASTVTSPVETVHTIEVINAGISGHKSTDMAARFQRDVVARHPDLVTINVGINDVWHAFRDFARGVDHPNGDLPAGVPLPLYRDKLTEMVRAAKAANIRVVLVSPTVIHENLDSPENRRLDRYVAAMHDLARENGLQFVDLNRPFKEVIRAYQKHAGRAGRVLTVDGVHMNPAGNRVMAYTILLGLGVPEGDIRDLKVE